MFYWFQVLSSLRVCDIVQNPTTIDIFEAVTSQVVDLKEGREIPPFVPPTDLEDYACAFNLAIEAQKGIYGRSLTEFSEVPEVVLRCIGFLDRHGLYVTGLFRVPGNDDRINAIKRSFNDGLDVRFEDDPEFDMQSVHDVASALKLFFRELPEPLIPRFCFVKFLSLLTVSSEDFITAVREMLDDENFYAVNVDCLRYLLGFLVRVVRCSEYNKMNADNLAIVFAPTLLKPPEEDDLGLNDLSAAIGCVKRLIEEAENICENLWEGYPAGT